MNERIKELSEMSGFQFDEYNEATARKVATLGALIVRECIEQARKELISDDSIDKEIDVEDRCYLRGNNGGVVDVIVRIKQHFGVKE